MDDEPGGKGKAFANATRGEINAPKGNSGYNRVMRFHGHVKGGVVVPDHPEQLPEGAQVSIEVIGEPATEPRDPENTDRPFQGILALAGKAEGLPPDAARNYKHYLYGMPKEE